MKSQFKQWCSPIPLYQQNEKSPLISTKLIEHNKTMRCDVGNPGPGLGQAQYLYFWTDIWNIWWFICVSILCVGFTTILQLLMKIRP
jgi:hypothetical protein